jgi:hypothetical protein
MYYDIPYQLSRLDNGGSILVGAKNFLYSTMSRLAVGPTQPLIQWELGGTSLGVKWLGCKSDRSPPSSAKAKNGGDVPPLSPMLN